MKVKREKGNTKILLVGGTWSSVLNNDNQTYGRKSSLVEFVYSILNTEYDVDLFNGGNYSDLQKIINTCYMYDIVFWWPNVLDNTLPKIRDVKSVAPKTMLVTSKRNDGNRYSFMELTQQTLAAKANLTFEFNKVNPENHNNKFKIRVFDPLGCLWYEGFDIAQSVHSAMDRLKYLRSITRQNTIQSSTNNNLVLSWYFDQFKQPEFQSDKQIGVPDEAEFVSLVREYAEQFYKIMNPVKNVQRFLGNASIRPMPPQVGRCSRGMPSFKIGDYVFVSQRNIDKQFINLEHFVPCYMEDGKLYYCGENKPSVDTPIQMRLYEALPNIRYIIHSHCYIYNVPCTSRAIPCGAIEEVSEVLDYIDNVCGSRNLEFYAINLFGHGSLLMAKDVELMKNVKYVGRNLPEVMF